MKNHLIDPDEVDHYRDSSWLDYLIPTLVALALAIIIYELVL